MCKLSLEKTEEADQIVDFQCIMQAAREFQKYMYFCIIDYAKAFDYVDYNIL